MRRTRGHHREVDEVRPGDEEHGERGQRDDHRRAEVRLLEHERDDRQDDDEERDGAAPEPADLLAALGEPVGEVDDEGELRELGRVDRGQRRQLEPARRAADLDVERRHEDEHEQGDRDDVHRDRGEAQVAVVDPHHRRHRDEAEDGPLDLRADGRERVGVLRQVALERRRRVDHQDADGGQRDDHDEDHVVGLVPLPPEGAAPALDRRPVRGRAVERAARRPPARGRGPARPGTGRTLAAEALEARDRRVEVHRSPPPSWVAASLRHGSLERPAPRGVVDEHVEAGGGRAEQHGRDGRRPDAVPCLAGDRIGPSDRCLEVGRALGPGETGGAELGLEIRPALADERPRPTRARRRPGASAERSMPFARPPAMSTIGGSNARRAAMTASGCVPCESLMKRTPSIVATGSSRCSTPVNADAATRIRSGSSAEQEARRRWRPARSRRCGRPGWRGRPAA